MKNKKLNNLKLENKTVGLRKKLGIIAVIFLLIFATGITSATIKLKDPSGSDYGYWGDGNIITSNNGVDIKSWIPTGENFQKAVWFLNGTGGEIIPSIGNVELTSPIVIEQDYITIRGRNRGYSTMFTKNADMPNGMFQIKGTGTGDMTTRVTLENLYFENKNTDIWIYDGPFVNVTYSSSILIENCHFRFNKDEAVVMRTVWNSVIDKCYIQRCGNDTNNNASILYESADGGTSVCTTPWITNNIFEAGGDWCIKNTDGYAKRAHILSNWFEYETVSGANMPSDGFIGWSGHYATISDNKIYGDGSIGKGIYSNGMRNIITENDCQNLDYGIDVGSTSTVANNRISACLYRGIQAASNNIVNNNFVSNCGDPANNYRRGIHIASNNIVMGNTVEYGYSLFRQIYVYGDDNIVQGNLLKGNASTNYGIYVDAISDNNFISNNDLEGTFANTISTDTRNCVTYNLIQDVLDAKIPTSASSSPVSGSIYWSESNSSLMIYNATSAGWMSSTFT